VRKMRIAISPRFATSTLVNGGTTAVFSPPGSAHRRRPSRRARRQGSATPGRRHGSLRAGPPRSSSPDRHQRLACAGGPASSSASARSTTRRSAERSSASCGSGRTTQLIWRSEASQVQPYRTITGKPPNGGWHGPWKPRKSTSSVRLEKGTLMLEWKARILTLLVAFVVVADQLGEILSNNWNW
jgi:hypothetical protein